MGSRCADRHIGRSEEYADSRVAQRPNDRVPDPLRAVFGGVPASEESALFPGTANDTLDDWLRHFNFRAPARHRALADAYSLGALLLVVLERATRMGLHTVGDLVDAEKAQRWLGRVR